MNKYSPFWILLAATALSARAEQTFEIPSSSDAQDVDIVSDHSGTLHSIVARNAQNNSGLRYYFANSGAWSQGPSLASNQNPNRIYGIDLEVDNNGTLHAAYFNDGDVFYGKLTPTAAAWTTRLIDDGRANPSDFVKSIQRASISLKGNTPQVVYNKRSGDIDILSYYASLINLTPETQIWQSEEIPGITNGLSPVISSEALPASPELITGPTPVKGPTVAYYEAGDYKITQRTFTPGATPAVTWTSPTILSQSTVSNPINAPGKIRSELKIHDGILHFVANARNPDDNSAGIFYHRWNFQLGLPSFINKTIERAGFGDSGDSSYQQSSLTLSSSGTPHVAFHANNPNGTWSFKKTHRLGFNQWETEDVLEPASSAPGIPEVNAITIDPLGRTAVISTRLDNVPTRIVRDNEFNLSSETFPIPSTALSDAIPGSLAINGNGGIGYAYRSGPDSASFLYRNPRSNAISTVSLDLVFPMATTNNLLREVLVTAVGEDYHVVATQVTWLNPGGRINRIEHRLHRFKNGIFIGSNRVFTADGLLIDIPQLSLAGDESLAYLASFPFTNSPATLVTTTTDGQPANNAGDLASSFRNTLPFGYRDPVLKVRDGSLAVLGKLNGSLSVHHRTSDGSWDSSLVQETPSELRDGYDLFLQPGGAHYLVSFIDDTTVKVATSVPSAVTPNTGDLSSRIVRDLSDIVHTGISQGEDRVLHILMKPSDLSAGIFYESYRGLPEEDFSNAITQSLVATQATTESFTFDRFSSPVIVANESENGQTTRLLYTNPLTQDPDGDGMPTFMELAFQRDPQTPDASSLLALDFSITAENKRKIELSFERPPGRAIGTRSGIEVGVFAYDIEVSNNLSSFVDGRLPFQRTPADGETPSAFGNMQKVTFLERSPDFLDTAFFRVVPRFR